MKFVKKPIVVEAEQFFWALPWPDGCEHNWDNNPMTTDKVTVNTKEGRLNVSEGDWIITGIQGEKYPCAHDIFIATYDIVTEEG